MPGDCRDFDVKSTNTPLGLLLNFGEDSLHFERVKGTIPIIAVASP